MMHGLMSHDLYSSVVLVKLSSVSGNFPQLSVLHVATIAQTDKNTHTHVQVAVHSLRLFLVSIYMYWDLLRYVQGRNQRSF